jgi:hypothetical protein
MEIAKEIMALIKDVAWPIAILTIAFLFRRPLIALVSSLTPEGKRNRNFKFKIGSFELESQLVAKTQERIKAIAEEPNLQKRLQMAKEPLLVEDALKKIDEKGIEALDKLYSSRLVNAFYVNWYQVNDDGLNYGIDRKTLTNLYELGLIKGAPMYDGDEIAWVTSTGLALLDKLGKRQEDSRSIADDT